MNRQQCKFFKRLIKKEGAGFASSGRKLKGILNPLIFLLSEGKSHIIKGRKVNISNEILMRDMEVFCKERNLEIV